MVWFQCEDCGENLKKPKLPNHFRCCSAFKLSCIDCGETFSQQSVQAHNQCISEAEKYGPKGQGKASNGTTPKPKNKPDVDINVGLTSRPPWYCSLCNTNATSQQALLLHADGKKHRGKARAFHFANQPPKQTEEPTSNTENTKLKEDPTKVDLVKNGSGNENTLSGKKRKCEISVNEVDIKKVAAPTKEEKVEVNLSSQKKIKWKKLITTALKSSQDGTMKMRKLKKLVIESGGVTEDEDQLSDMLEQKINSSSKFKVDNKLVHLVTKS